MMKANESVTNQEVQVGTDDLLVIKTDLHGQVSYGNELFLKATGYTGAELEGVSEERVRHPDIPVAVYQDLWASVKNGFPWKGVLKYRCRNGDHVWLQTNVTPVYRNFRVEEVLFVCYSADRHRISEAEERYRGLATGKSSMRAGRGILSRMDVLSGIRFDKQIMVLIAAALIGWAGVLYSLVQQENYVTSTIVAVFLVVVGGLGLSRVRVLRRVVDQMTNALYRLTDGEFRNELDIDIDGNLGDLLRAMQGMQVKLNFNMDEVQSSAVATSRLKQALDNVATNVMVADTDYNIIYLNKGVQQMFETAEDDIRQDLPDFETASLLGKNIDGFHQRPEHQRHILEKLNGTFESTLKVGGRTFNFIANPVLGDRDQRIGTVVEWQDRTQEVSIQKEIGDIVDCVRRGELGSRLELEGKTGFLAELSQGINELSESVESVIGDISHVISAMSSGDLDDRIINEYDGAYATIKEGINSTQDKLGSVFGQIREAAGFINNSSQEIASGNNNLSQRADQQASSLQQTASSMEQLTGTVKNNSDNAQQANDVANSARELAEKGGDVVNRAVLAMDEINTASTKIAEIIGVIDEIAFQTNLLALNASVEAARAGDQGRGFSVVATEVRNLAQRSATAAKESKELIQSSVEKVRVGADLVHESGDTLTEIVSGVKKVGDFVAEIAAASQQQSAGIEQVNQAIAQMDRITQQNAALAEEASAASLSMSEQSNNMMRLLGFFKQHEQAETSVAVSNTGDIAAGSGASENNSPRHRPAAAAGPVSPDSGATARILNDQEWEEF